VGVDIWKKETQADPIKAKNATLKSQKEMVSIMYVRQGNRSGESKCVPENVAQSLMS